MSTSDQRPAVCSQRRIAVVTGSDTGVGKTVVTAWLTRFARAQGINAVALKPMCSGGRDDAAALHAANDGVLTLTEVNPWHFRAALAPVLAARREGRGVAAAEVITQVRAVARRFEWVVVESAGGLLSPLGEGFDTRDWITAFRATPVVVVPNRLGAVNQARLVLAALPKSARARAVVVLMSPPRRDASARTNAVLLEEFAPGVTVVQLPWAEPVVGAERRAKVRAALKQIGTACWRA
ncbi:MAG: dethiobiotin synthase [Pedosphaera sp. Tous-C6FEB]|nr:MAG: dethiobiotin synthase [Pedosphaera sp. Tous-C6FEB]